jgi:hypothetical protein
MVYCMFIILALYAGSIHRMMRKKYFSKIQSLERELQALSGVVSQIMEFQMNTHRKYSANIDNLEERIMELSIPSHDPNLPLERRHQVLALARQGVGLPEIVKRLKAPMGEAELILNLGKFMSSSAPNKAKSNEQVEEYA